jgi:hypothetical protein
MTNRSKALGTAAESAVVKALRANGFPGAERRALHGSADLGDILVCPGVIAEVKGGNAARIASDAQVLVWLAQTEVERVNARADEALLIIARKGIGTANADRWWALFTDRIVPCRYYLKDACWVLREDGFGSPNVEDIA